MTQLKIEKISAIAYRLFLYSRRKNYSLEAAASVDHVNIVKLLLKQRDILNISDDKISHVIKIAVLNFYWFVVQLFFDDVAKRQSIKSYIETILEIGILELQSQIVNFAFVQIFKHCSTHEIVELKSKLIMTIDKYYHDFKINQKTLISDFAESCKNDNVQIIDAIFESRYHEALFSREINAGFQLCALNDQNTVVQMFLETLSLKGRQSTSEEKAFVVTINNGFVKIMKLFIFYWIDELITINEIAVIQALVTFSSNDYIDMMRYLIRDMLANVNNWTYDKSVEPVSTQLPNFSKKSFSSSFRKFIQISWHYCFKKRRWSNTFTLNMQRRYILLALAVHRLEIC